MKVIELRIGNLVCINNKSWKEYTKKPMMVTSIDQKKDKNFEKSDGSVSLIEFNGYQNFNQFSEFIQPINLTEDWLPKFGFEKLRINEYVIGIDNFIVKFHENKIEAIIYRNSSTVYSVILYSVHELQNLYFSLFKDDLILKQ